MPATDPNSLLAAAEQYQSLVGGSADWVTIYLLAQIAGAPYSTMTANQLIANAQQYQSITGDMAKWVIIYLLAQIMIEE